MVLFDAVYINNGGGKVLLDYLIQQFEKSGIDVVYLLDARIKWNHPSIKGKEVIYIRGGLFKRRKFYKVHGKRFARVFCFGNVPPPVRLNAEVSVYFHQYLFLNNKGSSNLFQKSIFGIKSWILNKYTRNADKWLVQSAQMKTELVNRFPFIILDDVMVVPFYPPLAVDENILRNEHSFLYVSSGAPHKNHLNLLAAFKIFFDRNGFGELHITVGQNFKLLNELIKTMQADGYPVINHVVISRDNIGAHYQGAKFMIFPSYAESFGLGLVEAIQCGCTVIGADLPYLHAVCETPFIFDPTSANSIADVMELAVHSENVFCQSLVEDNIEEIISQVKTGFNEAQRNTQFRQERLVWKGNDQQLSSR